MEFFQVDVFAGRPYEGNPIAIFPEAGHLSADQMQQLAREMNLSESVFVMSIEEDSYDVRIFTPTVELPFAGHPTIGCAWLLSRLELMTSERFVQRSPAGSTSIWKEDDDFWLERKGTVDEHTTDPDKLERLLRLSRDDLTLKWDEASLHPAIADAGLTQMIVPIRDLATLEAIEAPPSLDPDSYAGAYCFTRTEDGIRARGFFPDVGIVEDPATGSACAALGLYLGKHIGDVETVVVQGVEIGRRSVINTRVRGDTVSIGGSSQRVLKGMVEALP